MSGVKFFGCDDCKTIIRMIESENIPVVCNGQKMRELMPNTTDASKEKHTPKVEFRNDVVKVFVGEVTHPMEHEHSIEWVYLESQQGEQLKYLKKNAAPEVSFALVNGDHPIKVYAFCNLHGLWMLEM